MSKTGNIPVLLMFATGQWGMFTAAQALERGVSRTQLNRMVADGRLEPVSYGVYRVTGGDETDHASIKAAWLSLYPKETAYDRLGKRPFDAVATGRTAAFLYGYGDLYESPYCFIVEKGKRSARKDIELVHAEAEDEDVTLSFGIPAATPERMVADLFRTHEDPSHIDDIMADAARQGHHFDKKRLAVLLSPLAKRYGFKPNDGDSFASDLIDRNTTVEITSASEQRFKRTLGSSETWERMANIAALAQSNSEIQETIRKVSQVAPIDLPAIELSDSTLKAIQQATQALPSQRIVEAISKTLENMRPYLQTVEEVQRLVKTNAALQEALQRREDISRMARSTK